MNENIKEKIKALEETIERYSVDDELVTVCGDTLVLIYHVALDEFTYEITVKDDCYIVIEKFYSEVTGVTIEGNSKFNTLEEVIDFIL
jgi:hypothetical protein